MVCGRCGRKLTNPNSIITGLGPDCKKQIQYELSIKQIKMKCKHDFYCLPSISNISYINRLIERAKKKFKQYNLEWSTEAEKNIFEGLGLNKPKVYLTENEKERMFEFLKKAEDKDIARAEFFRRINKCPYGLNCTNPDLALESIYYLIGIVMKQTKKHYKVAKNFLSIIEPLIAMLEILGTNERNYYEGLKDIMETRAKALKQKEKKEKIANELEDLIKYL